MYNQAIELKTAPELKRLLSAIGYKKHKCYLSVFPEGGMNVNSYWDGGSRDEYTLMDLVSGQPRSMPSSTHPYFDIARKGIAGENDVLAVSERGNITLKVLPDNFAMIRTGTFCGRPATAHIFVPLANMPRLLTEVIA